MFIIAAAARNKSGKIWAISTEDTKINLHILHLTFKIGYFMLFEVFSVILLLSVWYHQSKVTRNKKKGGADIRKLISAPLLI